MSSFNYFYLPSLRVEEGGGGGGVGTLCSDLIRVIVCRVALQDVQDAPLDGLPGGLVLCR